MGTAERCGKDRSPGGGGGAEVTSGCLAHRSRAGGGPTVVDADPRAPEGAV